jgi:hypothetical protein
MTTIPGNNYTYTGDDLYQPSTQLIIREPTANSDDTFPTAVSLILSLYGEQLSSNNEESITVSISNNSAFNITIANNTGLTFFDGSSSNVILPKAITTYTFTQITTTTITVYVSGSSPQIQTNTNNTVITQGTGMSMGNDSTAPSSQEAVMTTWTNSTLDTTRSWSSVCYGNSLYVAVSNSGGAAAGLVRTSPDGITWSSRTAASANQWSSVCFGENTITATGGVGVVGRYVAVSANGTFGTTSMFSTNGITWTAGSNLPALSFQSVCKSATEGLFVAVNNNGNTTTTQIYTSADGASWAQATVPNAANPGWSSVCWSSGINLFVAVAIGGTTTTQIVTSPAGSGATWTTRTSPSARQWRSVCCSDALFVAVASDGTAAQQIMTSPNGITWTARTAPSAQQWQSVCWSRSYNMFVAVANNGTIDQQVMYSTDGINWASASASLATTWESIVYGAGQFVAVGGANVLAANAMRTTVPPNYNTDIVIGTIGTSRITMQGASVVVYPVPFYYSENSAAITLTLNTPCTDITIYNVPNGRYLVQIWMASYIKQTGAPIVTIRMLGSDQGTIRDVIGINPVGTAGGGSTTTGSKYFQFAIYSNSSVGFQDVSYQLISNIAGVVFTASWLRTMVLQRIG